MEQLQKAVLDLQSLRQQHKALASTHLSTRLELTLARQSKKKHTKLNDDIFKGSKTKQLPFLKVGLYMKKQSGGKRCLDPEKQWEEYDRRVNQEIQIKIADKSNPLEQINEYPDDFEQESLQNPMQIQTKELIGPNDIRCFNKYMKGTKYTRKNKVNPYTVHKTHHYVTLFEEHIQNRKLFIFQGAISKAILDLGQEILNPNTNEQDLRISIDVIKQQMLKQYHEMVPEQEMHPNTRFVFPMSFKNPFKIKIIELVPAQAYFQIVFEQQLPDDEQMMYNFQGAIEALLHIFEIEGEPRIQDIIIGQQSKLVLDTFDKQLPCLLILFVRHYEQAPTKQILINQYTIQRFFYVTHPIENLYQAITEGYQIEQFYVKAMEKYANNDKIKTFNLQVSSSDEQYAEKLTRSALAVKQQFKKSHHQSFLACFSIELQDQNGEVQDKVSVYFSIDRTSPKPAINYFLVTKDAAEQQNASLIFELISQGDQSFEVNVFTDFTRHNCLSYTDWTLPLWAHSTVKRKLSTLQAMRAIAFAMTPYYLAFKEMD